MLTMTDLQHEDKINYTSAEKIGSMKLLELLPSISDTAATITFLTIMNYITTTNLDKTFKIYKIWFSIFFLKNMECLDSK